MVTAKQNSKHKPPDTSQIYSYIRFSTAEQSLGDSERRQLEAAEKFAKDMGLPLNETLTDRGISGFKGEHKKANAALGRFLIKVENGEVPKGSILLVENIDRLGREPILDAFATVTKLIQSGISIQTLTPYQLYDIESVNSYSIYQLVGQMQRAYEESKIKSERISKARENARILAREKGEILTRRCPAWLRVIETGTNGKKELRFKEIPEAVETIKLIFEFKISGVGVRKIEKRLNAEAVWEPPKRNGWRASYIKKILQNPAVIGEYQPYKKINDKREPVGEPIQDYYPEVIKPEIFYTMQEQFKENKGKGGRTGKASNLFVHLVKCAYCGDSMAFVDKGKPPKGRKYLMCDNGRRGFKCVPYKIHYDECEELILENCKGLKPEQVLPNPDEQSRHCLLLHNRIQGYIGQQKKLETEKNTLRANLKVITNSELAKECEQDFEKLTVQVKKIKARQEEDERELKKAESSLQSFTKWQKDLATLQKAIKKDNSIELRICLRSHLRELIEKIEVFSVGFKEKYNIDKDDGFRAGRIVRKDGKKIISKTPVYFNNTETFKDELYDMVGEANPKFVRSKLFRGFVKDVVKRRMSKEGRFLRIHFKTGVWIDVVPKGSIASGSEMYVNKDEKKSWKFVRPDIDKLLNEYKMKAGKTG